MGTLKTSNTYDPLPKFLFFETEKQPSCLLQWNTEGSKQSVNICTETRFLQSSHFNLPPRLCKYIFYLNFWTTDCPFIMGHYTVGNFSFSATAVLPSSFSSLFVEEFLQLLKLLSVSCPVGGSLGHTYSVLLPLADRAGLGYFDTCLLRGQEAANMAPPRTSRNDPPQAMKMAAPNSNLKNKKKRSYGKCEYYILL